MGTRHSGERFGLICAGCFPPDIRPLLASCRCSFLFAKWRRARGHGGRGADDEQQQGAEGGDHEDEGGWEGDRGVAGEEVGDVDTEGSETESEEALLGDVAPGGIR